MPEFMKIHADKVNGALSGLDRVRLRGTLRWLSSVRGMMNYLSLISVLLKDFKIYARHCTRVVRESTAALALAVGRPLQHLTSSAVRKEDLARAIAARDRIDSGLICVLTCVEPCYSFDVGPNREKKCLELRYGPSRCRHDYF